MRQAELQTRSRLSGVAMYGSATHHQDCVVQDCVSVAHRYTTGASDAPSPGYGGSPAGGGPAAIHGCSLGRQPGTALLYCSYSAPNRRASAGSSYQVANAHIKAATSTA